MRLARLDQLEQYADGGVEDMSWQLPPCRKVQQGLLGVIELSLRSGRNTEARSRKMGGVAGGGNVHGYNAEFNWTCFFCCLSASAGGALFGYDNGECLPFPCCGHRSQCGLIRHSGAGFWPDPS